MASLFRDSRGSWIVQVMLHGNRKFVYLGKIPEDAAHEAKQKISDLAACVRTASRIPQSISNWLRCVDNRLYDSLCRGGLCSPVHRRIKIANADGSRNEVSKLASMLKEKLNNAFSANGK